MIILKSKGITVSLEGTINRRPTKLGFSKIETINYRRKTESTRKVVDITINIQSMSEDDYLNFETMFLVANNSIDIEDTGSGTIYTNYYIPDETLNLEQKEDLETSRYIYTGSINFELR